MQERKGTLPGIKNASKKKTSLEGIKNAENNRSSSALPIMQYFGKVQPSRRIVKADGSVRQQSPWQKPTISDIWKAGFSGNMRTNYTPVTFQPESLSYFSSVESAGGTLTDNVKAEFDAFVVREKDAGRWSKIKRLYPFLGGKINSAVIDAVTANAATNNNFVDGDVDNLIGIYPDGSTKYMLSDTPYQIWSNDNILQIGAFLKGVSDSQAATNPYVAGVLQTSPSTAYLGLNRVTNSTNWNGKVGGTPNLPNVSLTGVDETVSILRFSSTSAYMMANQTESAEFTTTNTAVLQDNYQMRLFAASVNNATSNYTSQDINSIYFSEFTDLQEVKDFESSYKTFINNIKAYAALMDSYSGAAAAYSLRKLYSSYEGSAINVRRSSDNATQDIGFDGYVLDTASLLSFVGAGSGYVTTWYDQSGNGFDFAQASAALQPTIVNAGSLITDAGLPAISFDGVDDIMQSAFNFSGTALTQIMVNNYDYTTNTTTYPHLWSGNSYKSRVYFVGKAAFYYYTSGSGVSGSGSYTSYTTNGYNGLKTILSLSVENNGLGYDAKLNINNDAPISFVNTSTPLQAQISQTIGGYPTAGYVTKVLVSEFIQYPANKYSEIVDINNLINTYHNIY